MTTASFLGTGEMGSALTRAAAGAGHRVIAWNRTPHRATALRSAGVSVAGSVAEAVESAEIVVVCLFDHESVRRVLDPVADRLAGRRLVNVTTTTPDAARELADWSADRGADYLDGGIMAVPSMIGTPGSSVYYSGSRAVFDGCGELLETWGAAEYFGDDPGLASLHDLALLSAMYVMFAGFFHGAAMVATAGTSATEFAGRATAWLQALLPALAEYAEFIDGGDYTRPGQQSLEFSDISEIVEASGAAGISTEVVDTVQRLIRRQIDTGHGAEGFARVIESIRNPLGAA
ncbi:MULTISPECIES: NAD(P)-dependent oxidoreductase [Mycobacteriaceae]|uniref:Oxidoreductase n=2 Tax=Mycobacteriaceae TaxID=1762 RepID=A0AAD1J147_MYCMB|nr:NAD(P)-binding domain-containing protein [Mycolicibacterium monacense]MDA4102462.1 dehydrogenase [Mycolicibacterium monacense DSM 44395]ORB17889.1 6-phosphogluconate dehydrogenase [Mycolicibacterium monacense DSM 44395]QHP88678.1 NAD(P)-dependent oxidoreductase [Mycolicibacterium monacense DSM 44395]BBZ63883.1 oxidoreductase [Mycolicibacterium monacense]